MAVYFIQAGASTNVKIGYAVDALQRLRDLQAAHYETLAIIRLLQGRSKLERWMHSCFKTLRIRNEWFRFHPYMLTVKPPILDIEVPRTDTEAARLINNIEFAAAGVGLRVSQVCKMAEITPVEWKDIRDGSHAPLHSTYTRLCALLTALEQRV